MMFDECLSLLRTLVHIVGKVADLERAGVFLCHQSNLLSHIVELVHVFADLLVFLVHVLLDLNCQFVQIALGWVLKTFPLEITDVLAVRSYIEDRE